MAVESQNFRYKETIRTAATAESKFLQRGARQHRYAHVELSVSPLSGGAGVEFVDQASQRGFILGRFIPGIENGVRLALQAGPLGFEVTDLRVAVTGGSYHDVDSTAEAFEKAGATALTEALKKGSPVLLEPVLVLQVTIPEEWAGSILEDLHSRDAQVEEIEKQQSAVVVRARARLGKLRHYSQDLQSMTQGRGKCSMELAGYEQAPGEDGQNPTPAWPYT